MRCCSVFKFIMKRAPVGFLTCSDTTTLPQEAYNRVIDTLSTDGQDRYEEALDLLEVSQTMCLLRNRWQNMWRRRSANIC